jgi:hypothetical protein
MRLISHINDYVCDALSITKSNYFESDYITSATPSLLSQIILNVTKMGIYYVCDALSMAKSNYFESDHITSATPSFCASTRKFNLFVSWNGKTWSLTSGLIISFDLPILKIHYSHHLDHEFFLWEWITCQKRFSNLVLLRNIKDLFIVVFWQLRKIIIC